MINAFDNWKAGEFNADANTAWWDSLAQDFAEKEMPTPDNNLSMRLIVKEQLAKQGDKALDIGSGGGGFSIALSKLGVETIGIDVSPKMLELARKQSSGINNVSFMQENWHNLNLEEKGFNKAFDFVLANMTPAIIDSKTFVKMSEASRGWCLMVKPFNRTNELYDAINKAVGAPEDKKVADDTILYAFSILWGSGYRPYFAYEKQVWNKKMPVDKAVDQYIKRTETFCTLDDEKRKIIREQVLARAKDGFLEDTTYTDIVGIYWRVG